MPMYDVLHSYPLTLAQKQKLAASITHLHSTKFLTPSVFVHVKFTAQDASDNTYFIAGKPRVTSSNRILGMVRTSETRTKKHFDELGEAIEEAWYDIVNEKTVNNNQNGDMRDIVSDEENWKTTEAKKLRLMVFYPMITIRENGDQIPSAGQEAAWLTENHEKFQSLADGGDEIFRELLEEVDAREDLKMAYGA